MYQSYSGLEMEGVLGMEGVEDGNLAEFLISAGAKGWEVCGCFPSASVGTNKPYPKNAKLHQVTDSAEDITFVFKKLND